MNKNLKILMLLSIPTLFIIGVTFLFFLYGLLILLIPHFAGIELTTALYIDVSLGYLTILFLIPIVMYSILDKITDKYQNWILFKIDESSQSNPIINAEDVDDFFDFDHWMESDVEDWVNNLNKDDLEAIIKSNVIHIEEKTDNKIKAEIFEAIEYMTQEEFNEFLKATGLERKNPFDSNDY